MELLTFIVLCLVMCNIFFIVYIMRNYISVGNNIKTYWKENKNEVDAFCDKYIQGLIEDYHNGRISCALEDNMECATFYDKLNEKVASISVSDDLSKFGTLLYYGDRIPPAHKVSLSTYRKIVEFSYEIHDEFNGLVQMVRR